MFSYFPTYSAAILQECESYIGWFTCVGLCGLTLPLAFFTLSFIYHVCLLRRVSYVIEQTCRKKEGLSKHAIGKSGTIYIQESSLLSRYLPNRIKVF